MATPISKAALQAQFLGEKSNADTDPVPVERPAVPVPEKQAVSSTPARSGAHSKKRLRFSISIETVLAISIREYVTQKTISNLLQGERYGLSQFFSEAAAQYMRENPVDLEKG